MSSRAWPYIPGVPAAGHVTSRGFWHPGQVDGCVKCEPPARARRLLILGEAPGLTGDPATPLVGRNLDRLCAWSGLRPDAFELANLLDRYPGSAGRGAALPRAEADAARARLLPALRGRVVVLLGARLARLFHAGSRHEFVQADGATFTWIYHPSGLTIAYNEPGEQAAAGATLRRAVQLAERLGSC